MGTGLPCEGAGHRILIENSEYWLRNYGDLAMLEVTVRRIRRRWPRARIGIMTESPALVAAYFPGAVGITVGAGDPWGRNRPLDRIAALVGPGVVGPVAMTWLRARAWALPRAIRARDRLRRSESGTAPTSTSTSNEVDATPRIERRHPGAARAVREASLVLALGGGYLTDADLPQAGRLLDLLEYAGAAGIPTAMVGQGIGPMRDPELREHTARVLATIPVLAVRERRRAPALLESLGIGAEAFAVTGDDAVELAVEARKELPGNDIGVCLRIARYAPVARRAQDAVGAAVRTVAREFETRLRPLLIAETPGSPDRATTLPLVRGGAHTAPQARFVSARELPARVADCRVLVTGAYHLAVFALSQGIPVVALTSTEYYDDKFLGLEEMFGGGIRLIHLDDPELEQRVATAVREAWKEADSVREALRAAADDQVAASRQAFERVFTLLERTHADHA
ncbi:polysaccharide pyruvyl transferase family protein [Nocardia sp. NPDC050406]|uniref:polysaccharide pyruvyl transferase family protein n=1 Tax=Nocardia sp. NPDC050406 TaxID=3364318 RepID=UPI00378731A1